jgi:hypothetical protein
MRTALAKLGNPPLPPLQPWLMLSEPTLEGLHKLYQSGRPSLGLFNDDAGDFLTGHAMSQENRAKSAAGFSRLWDNGEFSRVRAGDGAAKFFGRRLALHVMVQPVIAESVLSDDVLTRQGFLPRCLMSWPESTIGTRAYVETDLSTDPAMLAYWAHIHQRLRASQPLRTGTRNELEPRALGLTPDAKARWIEIADAIEGDMTGDFADVKAWATKAGSQILRIAAVLTLIDNDDADVIRIGAIERAARLALYHLSEAVMPKPCSIGAKPRDARCCIPATPYATGRSASARPTRLRQPSESWKAPDGLNTWKVARSWTTSGARRSGRCVSGRSRNGRTFRTASPCESCESCESKAPTAGRFAQFARFAVGPTFCPSQ